MNNILLLIVTIIFSTANSQTERLSQHQCVSGNCNNGYGVKKYANGMLYLGEWWNDAFSGEGTLIMLDGSIYTGSFSEGLYHGQGTLSYTSIINNEGTVIESKGLYIGEWDKGQPNGEGSIFREDGSTYVGEWKNGEMNGKGIFVSSNGTIEEAIWKEGNPLGRILIKRNDYILRSE